ncbi:MAG: TetR/AcrR family transcriptional regulator [Ketobacter sp.]|uniref:TetR/AcrR family transcriptional regulator n=1 Tax=Ketobacter sp. MCCC 1A13808 TaxID=2602738 RepID=UPI0018DB39F7|nr:TetR/AcrR family transcriptional regulator [Ketobacter sp. MCCC 1A13808]
MNDSKDGPISKKAGRTRASILAAAENLFSTHGFASTRLEDVADELGLTRAALFYYFRDKQTLYDAMIAHTFGPLARQLEDLLADDGPVSERIEAATTAWVDEIVSRPARARLILRIVADGVDQPIQRIFFDNDQIPLKFWDLVEQGRKSGELEPLHDDPFHAASAIIGTTVFYVAALASLMPKGQFEPLDPKQTEAHKREAIDTTRRLLGIKPPKT